MSSSPQGSVNSSLTSLLVQFYRNCHDRLRHGGTFVTSGMQADRIADYLMRQLAELHTHYRPATSSCAGFASRAFTRPPLGRTTSGCRRSSSLARSNDDVSRTPASVRNDLRSLISAPPKRTRGRSTPPSRGTRSTSASRRPSASCIRRCMTRRSSRAICPCTPRVSCSCCGMTSMRRLCSAWSCTRGSSTSRPSRATSTASASSARKFQRATLVAARGRALAIEYVEDELIAHLTNFMCSELFAAYFFLRMSRRTNEPVLRDLLGYMSRDEFRHSASAGDVLKKRIDRRPRRRRAGARGGGAIPPLWE